MFWHGLRICRLVFAQLLISVFYQLDSAFKFPKAGPWRCWLPVLGPDKEIDSFSFCCNWQFENMKMDSQNLITAPLMLFKWFPWLHGCGEDIFISVPGGCLLCWREPGQCPPQLCPCLGATGGWRDSSSSLSRTVHWQTCPSGNTPPSRETHHRVPDM